jgi:hypothetical protein
MCNLIIFYLLHTNFNVIIIGNSHGALIIHGAIIKLKTIMNENLQKELKSNRIYIITNGSPRYLPKKLLANEQIYNIYNIEDKTLNHFVTRKLSYFDFPNFEDTDGYTNIFSEKGGNRRKILFLNKENYIYIKLENFKIKSLHTSGLNLYILFGCKFPNVLNHLLTSDLKYKNIKDFDRILYYIGVFYTNKEFILHYLQMLLINYQDNLFLNLLSDKDLFQLYLYLNPDPDIVKKPSSTILSFIFRKKRIEPNPDGIITIEINVDDKIKDNLNLLSINQLKQILDFTDSNEFSNPFEFITTYNELIEKIKSFDKIKYMDLLEKLRTYNKEIFIKNLKKDTRITEKIRGFLSKTTTDYDIKISIYISLTLKNLSSLRSFKQTI